jgi:hypothetical protein
VRNYHDGGWLIVSWTHLRSAPVPFGDMAWEHARTVLANRGADPATEAEIALAAAKLLDRAERGPGEGDRPSLKDRRVAGRTRATSTAAAGLRPVPPPSEPADEPDDDGDGQPEPAEVIPLGVFDAREEARTWW